MQTDAIKTHEATVADLTTKVHNYETASVKTKVALEMGLPYQMASRLAGDDEASIRADAEAMKALIGQQTPRAPLGDPESNNSKANGTGSLWAAVASQMNNE